MTAPVSGFTARAIHTHPVTITQAAAMLSRRRQTISMLHAGQFKLNKCGRIPIEQVDAVLLPV